MPARRRWTTRDEPSAPPVGWGTTVITARAGAAEAAASSGISDTSWGHGSGHSTSRSASNVAAQPIGSTPCAWVHGEHRYRIVAGAALRVSARTVD